MNPVEVRFKDFQDSIEKVTEILEEPLSNQSSILNYLMAKNVKEKVIFNGDGGDEVFGAIITIDQLISYQAYQK